MDKRGSSSGMRAESGPSPGAGNESAGRKKHTHRSWARACGRVGGNTWGLPALVGVHRRRAPRIQARAARLAPAAAAAVERARGAMPCQHAIKFSVKKNHAIKPRSASNSGGGSSTSSSSSVRCRALRRLCALPPSSPDPPAPGSQLAHVLSPATTATLFVLLLFLLLVYCVHGSLLQL